MKVRKKHYLDIIGAWASRFIRGKVRQLIHCQGFSEQEKEDLYHEFAIDLIERKPSFDPCVGTWEAFVVVVCENRMARIIEHRNALMRAESKVGGSLDALIKVGEQLLVFGDTLPDTQRHHHKHHPPRPVEDTIDLAVDVAEVLAKLPPRLRKICAWLMHDNKADAARAGGRSRTSIYKALPKLREAFVAAGLRKYL